MLDRKDIDIKVKIKFKKHMVRKFKLSREEINECLIILEDMIFEFWDIYLRDKTIVNNKKVGNGMYL